MSTPAPACRTNKRAPLPAVSLVSRIECHSYAVFDAKYSPTGDRLATASWASSATLIIWDAQKWTRLHTLPHTKGVNALSWHPGGGELLSAGWDGVHCWDAQTGEHRRHVSTEYMRSVAWFPSGQRFACGDDKGNVFVYSRDGQLQCVHAVKDGRHLISGLVAVNNSQLLVLASGVTGYKLCQMLVDENMLAMQWQVEGGGYDARLSPLYRDKHVLVGCNGSTLVDMWNIHTRTLEKQFSQHSSSRCVVFGGKYTIACSKGSAIVWDEQAGQQVHPLPECPDHVKGIAVSPAHPLELVSYGSSSSCTVWRMQPAHAAHSQPAKKRRLARKQ